MSTDSVFQDKNYLRERQYSDSRNLDARAALHRDFSTSVEGWQTWVFDHLELAPGTAVLECGCGPGWLWRENLARIPADGQITLTDLSPGMVAEAEAALAHTGHDFHFQPVDIQQLPFADASFDVVVANHMLYHVPDIEQALSEVRRVLKPGGRLYAVTNGEAHMQELKALQTEFAAHFGYDAQARPFFLLPFRLENGADYLSRHFETVAMRPFPDSLHVTEVEPLLAYIFSADEMRVQLTDEMMAAMRELVAAKMAASGGAIHVTKAVGMFVAEKQA
ncbi:MAG: class I SAM-dependent methyltransferase [Anaerolineales bacterium]|nr:class I SAM-dependent methyltransferase [Anaerolineales bacterium]